MSVSRLVSSGRTYWQMVAVLPVIIFQTGCYHYSPVTLGEVSAEMHVRVDLTAEKALDLEPELGGLFRTIDGELLDRDLERSAILLAVPRLFGGQNQEGARLRQRVWVDERDLIQIEVRSLDRGRTGLLAGGIGAIAGFMLLRALGAGSIDTEPPPNGGGVP